MAPRRFRSIVSTPIVVSSWNAVCPDGSGKLSKLAPVNKSTVAAQAEVPANCPASGASAFYRRTALDEAGLLDERFESYYELARETTVRLAQGEIGEGLSDSLSRMQDEYNAIRRTLENERTAGREGMTAAFSAALEA